MILDWWNTRELREKILIAIAAVLAIVIGFWFGVISPLAKAKSEAQQNLTRAIDDKALIDVALLRLGARNTNMARPADNFDAFRSEVTSLAQRRGLAIFRLQAGSDGSLQLTFNDVAPEDIFVWLEEIAARPGGEVVRANLTIQRDTVQAVIDLQGAQP